MCILSEDRERERSENRDNVTQVMERSGERLRESEQERGGRRQGDRERGREGD